jgi:hypothetical protein
VTLQFLGFLIGIIVVIVVTQLVALFAMKMGKIVVYQNFHQKFVITVQFGAIVCKRMLVL